MSRPMRVLLVNALNPHMEVERRYPGLGLAYLASAARRDLAGERLEFEIIDDKIPETVERFRPHVVGISSVSQNYDRAKEYADFCMQRGISVVLGGIHISALPRTMPRGVAAAVLGEGERTFVAWLKTFLGGRLTPETIKETPGLAYWEDDALRVTAPVPPIEPLDNLAHPARDLLRMRPHTYMFTSRGCPFRCTFCASSRFWSRLRFHSAEYVVAEIEELVREYRVNLISFFDDLFPARADRLEQILRGLEHRNLLGKVRFTCNCRANIVTEELAQLLARLGVVSVGLGLESGDEETLRYLKCGSVSVADNVTAVDRLKAAGVAANASFVIGSPRETREQILRTYDFIRNSRLDLFDVYLLTPFPGTPLWEYAQSRGLVADEMPDWSRLDVNLYRAPEKAIVVSETLSREDLIGLYRRFRRLRLRRNLVKVWTHPMLRDAPGMALRMLREKLHEKLRRRKGSPSR